MDEAIVRVEGIVKVFGRQVRALDGISLAVEPGIIFGLLGPNGAGKTSLIRVLATLLSPDAGTARIAGFDVRRQPAEVRARVGMAGQFAAVDDFLTGQENVEMVGRLYGLTRGEARQRAREVLERIRLGEAADRPVTTYSGGIRRRLDLAASLVGRPQLLFLDEPTAGLDPASRIDLWSWIKDLVATGTTVLLTTQYLDEADRLADRIAVLDHGRLISEGTAEELKARVGGSQVEMSVPEADLARALEALRGFSVGPAYDDQRRKISVPAPDGSRTLVQALRRLVDAGISPEDVTLHKPTLDDVFLVLTGHAASTGDGREVSDDVTAPGRHVSEGRSETRASPMTILPTASHRNMPAQTVSDIMVITWRNMVRVVRQPQLLLFSTIQPVVFMLLFNYVFGGAILLALPPAAAGSYVNWLMPGLLAQFALFSGGQTAAGLVEDLSQGVIDRFRSLPMARSAVLAGRTLSDFIRSTFILTLLLGVGVFIGFRSQTDLASLLGGLAVALAFGYAWSWVMATVGLVVRSTESVQAAVYLVIFPLAFASGVFVPTETMPDWLQVFTEHQPVTVVTSALRGLVLGAGSLPSGQTVTGQVILALVYSAAIMAVFAPLAVRLYRRSVR